MNKQIKSLNENLSTLTKENSSICSTMKELEFKIETLENELSNKDT